MIVTGWNHGDHQKSGAGYGVKLNADDRDQFLTVIGKQYCLGRIETRFYFIKVGCIRRIGLTRNASFQYFSQCREK